jgi:hypothetical protein
LEVDQPNGWRKELLPAFGHECSTAEGDGRTYKKLRECAVQGFRDFVGRKELSVRVIVDGKHLEHPRRWTFTSGSPRRILVEAFAELSP